MEARERLTRLVMGLEMSIPEMRERLQWIPEGDLERKYTEKFIVSMEAELAKAKAELAALKKDE
ncbi:MAG: hypothetical protein KGL53_11115 [Elusimicrobia bacterium]|nr:hypothetical protein [Elusimicrobiota bacterium]